MNDRGFDPRFLLAVGLTHDLGCYCVFPKTFGDCWEPNSFPIRTVCGFSHGFPGGLDVGMAVDFFPHFVGCVFFPALGLLFSLCLVGCGVQFRFEPLWISNPLAESPVVMPGFLFLIHCGLWIVATVFIVKLGC